MGAGVAEISQARHNPCHPTESSKSWEGI